jgi:hypothetical protein
MATGKKSFILYCDQRGTWERLSDEQAGKLIKHILSYVNDENPVADFVTELAFEGIKSALKRDLRKWETQQSQRIEAGRKSAELRKRKATKGNERSTGVDESSVPSTVNGNVNGNVNVSEKKRNSALKIEFDVFWDSYGKKEDRKKCETKWDRFSEAEKQKILNHVPKYVEATPEVKYRKNPYTYLNANSWLDEDLPQSKKQTQITPSGNMNGGRFSL